MNMREHLNTALYEVRRSGIREFGRLAAATPGCVALTLGEPDFAPPEAVTAAVTEALAAGETHYIPNNGIRPLLEAIAAFEKRENSFECSPDEIIVTAGATGALFTALFGILNPGDEVIIPSPAFVLYAEIVRMARAVPVEYSTKEDGFQINGEHLKALMNDKTKAILLNTPNNPTGTVYTVQSLEAVREAVSGKPVFVICDDVYRPLCYEGKAPSFADFAEMRGQTLLVQSFSKPYAMTGFRVGYLIAPAEVKERLELIHQYTVVSAPAPFQRACIAALNSDVSVMRQTYAQRRAYMLSRLSQMGLQAPQNKGAFYLFPDISGLGLTSETFCRRMIQEEGLAATPGVFFGTEGHIRLTYCYEMAALREGMDRLERFVNRLRTENGAD